jgi:hypothetical protein
MPATRSEDEVTLKEAREIATEADQAKLKKREASIQEVVREHARVMLEQQSALDVVAGLLTRLEAGYAFDGDGNVVATNTTYDGIYCRDATIKLLEDLRDEEKRAPSEGTNAGELARWIEFWETYSTINEGAQDEIADQKNAVLDSMRAALAKRRGPCPPPGDSELDIDPMTHPSYVETRPSPGRACPECGNAYARSGGESLPETAQAEPLRLVNGTWQCPVCSLSYLTNGACYNPSCWGDRALFEKPKGVTSKERKA